MSKRRLLESAGYKPILCIQCLGYKVIANIDKYGDYHDEQCTFCNGTGILLEKVEVKRRIFEYNIELLSSISASLEFESANIEGLNSILKVAKL